MSLADKMTFNPNKKVTFFGIFILGNVVLGFLSQVSRAFTVHFNLPIWFSYSTTVVLIIYLLFSSFLVFKIFKIKESVISVFTHIFLYLFLLSSLATFVLIGMISPLSFLGWYLYRGLFEGRWSLAFLTHMLGG